MGHMTQPPSVNFSTTMLASTGMLVQFENDGTGKSCDAAGRKFPTPHGANSALIEERPRRGTFRMGGNDTPIFTDDELYQDGASLALRPGLGRIRRSGHAAAG